MAWKGNITGDAVAMEKFITDYSKCHYAITFQNWERPNDFLAKQNWTKLIPEGKENLIRLIHIKGIK